jgi:LmbE family N-acetylglucosaminyl deacetylase
MLHFKPDFPAEPTVLCLGAHCDDIEIGCLGTLLELQQRYPGTRFHWVVFASDTEREAESRRAAARALGPACSVDVQRFAGSYLPYEGRAVKDHFESVAKRVQPDLIFTHHLGDRHQDHRLLAELTWNTFRRHAILEYEIPKYEGDLGHPNVYVPLAEATLTCKLDVLMESFPTQAHRGWFTRDLFQGHLRLRGIECNAASGHAEAFHGRKLQL